MLKARRKEMPLRLEDKMALVAEVNQVAASAFSAIAAEYRGLSVSQMTELRAKAREESVYVRVVKNTLAKRAVAGTEFECLADALKGPLVLAFSQEEPGAAARVIKSFAKDNKDLVTKAVAIGGDLYPASDLERLASLPTLDQARAMLLGLLQAPAGKFVRTIAEPPAMLARVIATYKDQQQAA
jgi:large subunit ribosomal protein L10